MKEQKNEMGTFPLLEIVNFDPLLRYLVNKNLLAIYLIVTAIYVLLILGCGIGISIYYGKRGFVFLSLLSTPELIWNGFAYALVVPIIWLSYTWQVKGYIKTLLFLFHSEVLLPRDSFDVVEFIRSSFAKINKRFFFLFPFALAVMMLTVWSILFTTVQNSFTYGYRVVWMNINPLFYWLVWTPLTLVPIYQMIWLIIRQIAIVKSFNELYEYCNVYPKIFHPDKCNGFSSVGDYAIKFSFIAVMFGIWVYLVIGLPTFFGGKLNWKPDTIFLLFAYIVVVPIALIPPVWRTHREMLNAKYRELNEIAVQIQNLMRIKKAEQIQADEDVLENLQKRYLILETEMKAWPFRPLSIKGFGVSAIAPLIPTLISFLLEK